MKFGKQIQGQALTEWSAHYMNYKALKKVINSIQYPPSSSSAANHDSASVTLTASPPAALAPLAPLSAATAATPAGANRNAAADPLQSLKATFFFKLERELDRVNAFYLTKEADVKLRLRTLVEKKRLVRDTSDNPATLRSIQEALWQVQQELTKLQQYVELNATGFRKILKKWDKRSKSSTKELYLARQVEIQPCFNRDTLTELTDLIAHHLAELAQLNIHLSSPASHPQLTTTPSDSSTTTTTAAAAAAAVAAALSTSSSPVSTTLRPVPSPLDDLDTDLAHAAKSGDRARLTSLIHTVPAQTAQVVIARLIQRIARSAVAADHHHQAQPTPVPPPGSSNASPAPHTTVLDLQLDAVDTLLTLHPHAALVTDDINQRSAVHCAALARLPRLLSMVLAAMATASPSTPVASVTSSSNNPLDARDMYGRTPLHYAAMHADLACATMLVRAGAHAELVDHDGCTSLVYAVVAGHVPLVDLFLNRHATDAKKKADAVEAGGHHLVALAARYGHLEVGKMLMERGMRVECDEGLHPLHITAKQGHLEFTQLLCTHLLSQGTSIDISDKYYNWTPLFYAASEGHVDCCQALLDHGACASWVDETGWTAMTHALYRGHVQVANLLTDHAAAAAAAAAQSTAFSLDATLGDVHMTEAAGPQKEIQPIAPSRLFVTPAPPAATDDTANDDGAASSMDLDAIPSLALPPPILPFRIYGHMYLESKYQIQLAFPTSPAAISLYAQNLASLRLVVAAKPDPGGSIPHTIILPLDSTASGDSDTTASAADVYAFQLPTLDVASLHVDVYPVYGTRPIARGVVLARELAAGPEHGQWVVPLFDGMALVGELTVKYAIVAPFTHPRLAVGGAVATYWKTTQVLGQGQGNKPAGASSLLGTPSTGLAPMLSSSTLMASPVLPSSASATSAAGPAGTSVPGSSPAIASLITASSLAHKYVHVPVHISLDGVPVVHAAFAVDIAVAPALVVPVPIAQLTAQQFQQVGRALGRGWNTGQLPLHPSASQLAAAVRTSHFTLRECLETIPREVGVVIEVKYQEPTKPAAAAADKHAWGVNALVDKVLKDVYDSATSSTAAGSRPVIFCSLSRAVCNAINWKQPNYAVFFSTYAGYPVPVTDAAAPPTPMPTSSLKEAIRFAKTNNMLGVLVYAKPMVQVPALVPAVKEAGLLCATFGEEVNADPRKVMEQERAGVDGVFSGGVLRFTTSASEGM